MSPISLALTDRHGKPNLSGKNLGSGADKLSTDFCQLRSFFCSRRSLPPCFSCVAYLAVVAPGRLLPQQSYSRHDAQKYLSSSRTSLRQCQRRLLAGVQFPHSIERCGNRICLDRAFQLPKQVQDGLFRLELVRATSIRLPRDDCQGPIQDESVILERTS